jgi:hypothetical protein
VGLLAISATAGFGSFLAYLGYGYLDTWHGVGTALLLPFFVIGLLRSRRLVGHHLASPLVLLAARDLRTLPARGQAGRACLLLGAVGTALGGAVFTLGLTAFFCLWCSPPTKALWEAMLVSGSVGLTAAIGVHGFVGYTDLWHLAPALAAAASMIIGLGLTSPSIMPARGSA